MNKRANADNMMTVSRCNCLRSLPSGNSRRYSLLSRSLLEGPHHADLNLSASGKRTFTFSKIFEWMLSDQKIHTTTVAMQTKPVVLITKIATEEIIFLLSTAGTCAPPRHQRRTVWIALAGHSA